MSPRALKILSVSAASLLCIVSQAGAETRCKGVDTVLTAEHKAAYSKLVVGALNVKVPASEVEIDAFMSVPPWTVVYASVPVADPAYFFFETANGKPEFKEIWAGMADEGEGPELVRWAEKLGAPKLLAECFAKDVMD